MTCVFNQVEKRLSDSLHEIAEMESNYFSPDKFRRHLNNSIQTLRNTTWVLQALKGDLPNFELWYLPWQDRMKKNKALRWLVDSRNHIVKAGDLATHSTAKAWLFNSWDDSPLFEDIFDPSLEPGKLAQFLLGKMPTEIINEESLLKVERIWKSNDFGDLELTGILKNCYIELSQLLHDAHVYFSTIKNSEICKYDAPQITDLYLNSDNARSVKVRVSDMKSIEMARIPVDIPDEALSISKERNLYLENLYIAFKQSEKVDQLIGLKKRSLDWFCRAMALLKYDQYHDPMALVISTTGSSIIQIRMDDRVEKGLALRELAAYCKEVRAQEVHFIGESWTAKADPSSKVVHAKDSPTRREALSLMSVTSTGEVCVLIKGFQRLNKEIVFDQQFMEWDDSVPNIMKPIADAIKKV